MLRSSHDKGYSFQPNGEIQPCINLGSYNYLGFADDWKNTCRIPVAAELANGPIASYGCSRSDIGGSFAVHEELEQAIAAFVGKEAALVYGMGYDTNLVSVAALMSTAGSLIISDVLNHTSLVNGARRCEGAAIRVFHHNDPVHLEAVLREAIAMGQPRLRRPWRKIMVIVEGVYSMEGDLCQLRQIAVLCKQYKCSLYVDEAHSIGALGETGRGICEHAHVNPADVTVLMGTFTKSFAGMGGYIAGSVEMIRYLKATSSGMLAHTAMSPVIARQIVTALNIINSASTSTALFASPKSKQLTMSTASMGRQKLDALHSNALFFRGEMKRIGLHVLGHDASPIVPVLVYSPTKLAAFSRECLARGVAVVVVGFPAVSFLTGRCRFCLSAAHTRVDLERAAEVIEEVAEMIGIRYGSHFFG